MTFRRLSTGPALEVEKSSLSPPSAPSPSSSLATGPSLYTVGEEVLALWKQNRKYPATIQRIQEDGCYLVSFYDGFEKVVRGQCIRRVGTPHHRDLERVHVTVCIVGKQDLDFVRQCKDQLVTNGERGEEEEEVNKLICSSLHLVITLSRSI